MRFLLISASLLFATHYSFAADDDVATSTSKMASIQTTMDKITTALDGATKGKVELNNQITAMRKKMADAHCDITGNCRNNATMSPADAVAMGKKMSDLNDQIDSIDKSVTSMNASMLSLTNSKEIVSKEVNTLTPKRLNTTEVNLANLNKKMGLVYEGVVINTKLTDLKWSQADLKSNLDIIEKEMDNSKTGVYLQDKLGALLNSHLFCDAVNKHCIAPSKFVVDRDNMKEIFPDVTESNARSGADQRSRTYDKKSKTTDQH